MRLDLLKKRRQDRGDNSTTFEGVSSHYELNLISDCEALYKGSAALESKLEDFLPRPELMTNTAHALMKSIAKIKYVNLFATVVNYFPDFLFSFPLIFKTPNGDFYSKFKENCDGSGKDFQDLVRLGLIEYLVGKRVAVAVELPRLSIEIKSERQAKAMGAQDAFLRIFGAAEIFDWEKDDQGNLVWIVLYATKTPRESPAHDSSPKVEQFWVHYRDRMEYYEATGVSGEVLPIWTWSHGLGFVPVVMIEAHEGKWLGERLRNPCIDHLRARTALGFHNNKTAFPVVVHATADTETNPKLGESGVKIGVEDTLTFLVPPAESREALENDVRDAKISVFHTANLGFLVDAEKNKPWRSAAAKQSDTDAGHITVKDYGAVVRDFAKSILQAVAKVRRDSIEGIDVTGFEKLDDMDIESFANILQVLSTVDFTVIEGFGSTARKNLMQRLILKALPDADESVKKMIEAEIQASKPVKPEPTPKPQSGETKRRSTE